ncbi:MAG: phosphatidate cytidylyltransferase [Actinomycetota bacterium]
MAGEEGEGREKEGEDLFEDLDKFFAPIQNVDWPEPSDSEEGADAGAQPESPSAEPEAEAKPEPEPASPSAEELPDVETPVTEQVSLPESEEPSADSNLPEEVAAADETEDAEFDERDFRAPPPEYTGLPAEESADEGVEVVAEIEEDVAPAAAQSEEPEQVVEVSVEATPEEVEAAAERFAESVRQSPAEVEEEILADLDEDEPSTEAIRVDASDTMTGPSWQEPTSEEVAGIPTPGAPGGRDVPAAFLTGLVLGAVALGTLFWHKAVFAVFASAVVLLAQGELYGAMRRQRRNPATLLGLIFGALILAGAYLKGEAAVLSMMALSVVFAFLWEMATPSRGRKNVMVNVSLTIFGIAYVPFLAAFALVVLAAPTGRALVLAFLGLTFAYDTVAFAVGSLWGDHAIAPSISPKKSVEGLVGATLVVAILSMAAVSQIQGIDPAGAAGLAVVVAILAPLGDLAESLLKRDLGVKDMGSILPGHGGVLDRIDSILFVAPGALILFRILLG